MKRAIYPGSFDPITNGHLDIIKRARLLFDEVVIAVIQNPEKKAFFPIDDRIALIKAALGDDTDGISVEGFQGLLVDYAKAKQINTVVRGLRALSDFEFEFQMALTNRSLYPEIDTMFLMTDVKYSYLSSSLVRQVSNLGGDIDQFVPSVVKTALLEKSGK